jgi:branched-chain amino acid transport system permease protein
VIQAVLDIITQGLAVGSIYALLALGFAMEYGVSRMSNFAHGDFAMIGAMFFGTSLVGGSIPVPLAFIVVPLISAAVAVTVAWAVYRPVFSAPRVNLFIVGIGTSIFLENTAIVIWGPATRPFPSLWAGQSIHIAGTVIPVFSMFIVGLLILLTTAVSIFVLKTKAGIASRAVAQDVRTAMLMGVGVNRLIYLTFVIGGILSGLSGVTYAMYFGITYPLMGFTPILKAFVAVVAGGIGSLPGAVLGGLVLGLAESVGARYISSGYEDAISFGLLVAILLIRPQGILGKRRLEKV